MGTESKTFLATSNMTPPSSTLPMESIERAALEKRLVRKLDTRLMPVLFVMIILK
jgi:hypothetical protein